MIVSRGEIDRDVGAALTDAQFIQFSKEFCTKAITYVELISIWQKKLGVYSMKQLNQDMKQLMKEGA